MSSFTQFSAIEQLQFDHFNTLKYKKPIYQVAEGYRYYVGSKDSNIYIDVPTGFLTDGATIPRIFWWYLPPIDEYSQATTLHDFLCGVYEYTVVIDGVPTPTKITRKQIDAILGEAMGVLEVTRWKRKGIMFGVNLYRFFARPSKPKSLKESFS